jgi:hypothetical protein
MIAVFGNVTQVNKYLPLSGQVVKAQRNNVGVSEACRKNIVTRRVTFKKDFGLDDRIY